MVNLAEECPTGMMPALLERDETGGVSGTDTGTSVLHGLVGDRELAKVVADHLGLDFNLQNNSCVIHLHF